MQRRSSERRIRRWEDEWLESAATLARVARLSPLERGRGGWTEDHARDRTSDSGARGGSSSRARGSSEGSIPAASREPKGTRGIADSRSRQPSAGSAAQCVDRGGRARCKRGVAKSKKEDRGRPGVARRTGGWHRDTYVTRARLRGKWSVSLGRVSRAMYPIPPSPLPLSVSLSLSASRAHLRATDGSSTAAFARPRAASNFASPRYLRDTAAAHGKHPARGREGERVPCVKERISRSTERIPLDSRGPSLSSCRRRAFSLRGASTRASHVLETVLRSLSLARSTKADLDGDLGPV